MSIRRFRKPITPWRSVFLLCGIALFVAFRLLFPVSRTTLDPTRVSVESGEYVVESVLDSARLRLASIGADRDTFELALLATVIDDLPHASKQLRNLIGEKTKVHVRFDRRRISEGTKELQAYVFVGELCLNAELARLGLAREDTHPSDAGPMIRRIKKAEQEAREQRRGIWK